MKFNQSLQILLASLFAVLAVPMSAQNSSEAPPAESLTHSAETSERTQNIARLIEVWGFVKYHHPDALEGRLAMDGEFFELYPAIRDASSPEDADAIFANWLDELGRGAPCNPCAETVDAERIAIPSSTPQWLASLPSELSSRLQAIYENRSGTQANFLISTARNVGNPIFANENDYSNTSRLDEETLHILTLARQWNTLRYWFPYRDVMDEPPSAILERSVRDFLAAESLEEKQQARIRLGTYSNDGHVGISAYRLAVSPKGRCGTPYGWRFVEGKLAIDGRTIASEPVLKRGDIVLSLDGESIEDLASRYGPYIAVSKEANRPLYLASRLGSGPCGEREIQIERDGEIRQFTIEWLPLREVGRVAYPFFVDEGDAIEELSDGIVYVRFPELKRENLPELLSKANAGRGVVLDMRGYVGDFLVFELGKLLVDEPTDFATFTVADVTTPGRFVWSTTTTISPDPEGRRIEVPVVALLNSAAASSPEYHAMGFRAAGVPLIGSPTAGADGNVSKMLLPDGAEMRFSGIGVFYPDQSPTQRVGIVPDILVDETLEGFSEGRDEVLERALEHLRSMQDDAQR